MENQKQLTRPSLHMLLPEEADWFNAVMVRDMPERNRRFQPQEKKNEKVQTLERFPAGQWINRGENDGLDFFL